MRSLINMVCIGTLVAAELAVVAPALAQPTDKMARPGPGRPDGGRPGNGNAGRPPGGGGNIGRPPGGNHGRPPGGGNFRPPSNGYRPPGNNYRPPQGGNYRPPRPPPGGWHGGYRPPENYYYDRGPSTGGIIAGVAVAGGLIALLSAANRSSNTAPPVQGQPQAYVPPQGSSGIPANVNVDLTSIATAARPSASTCLTEAAREIGATGGSEIRLDNVDNVEKGNGGYRFRMTLVGVYPNETRRIPMFCRATPGKIVELTFG